MFRKTLTSVGFSFLEVVGVAGTIKGVLTVGIVMMCGTAVVTTSGMS